MTRKVLSDLFDDGGKTKIHTDEVSDYNGKVLSEIIGVETGSNANGEWQKFPDGRLKCKRLINLNQTTNQATGSLFRTPTAVSYDYPIPFIEPPSVSATLLTNLIAWPVLSAGVNVWSGLRFYSPVNNQTINQVILKAEGRWKE